MTPTDALAPCPCPCACLCPAVPGPITYPVDRFGYRLAAFTPPSFHMTKTETALSLNDLTHRIIGAAIAVHEELGPGLLESPYQEAMEIELRYRDLGYEREKAVRAVYRGVTLRTGYVIDLLVEGRVVVALKAVERFEPVFTAQLLTYLKLTSCQVGLLINFRVPVLKQGIKRVINDLDPHDDIATHPRYPIIRD